MLVQKLAVIGVLIAAIIVVVLASLITNSIRNTKSSLSASPATTAVAETLVNSSNSYNSTTSSTNNTSQLLHHPENLTLSPSTHHPPLPAPQNKSLSEQPQENRLRGPPLPSSCEPIRGPVPGTASP